MTQFESSATFEATLRFATALVLDGISHVTLIVPRAPGTLTRARAAARFAGVRVRADEVGSSTITMRFSAQRPNVMASPGLVRDSNARSGHALRAQKRWKRLFG